ncbi:MAG: hypothetical protein R2709_11825 [Marmoricola sp.]
MVSINQGLLELEVLEPWLAAGQWRVHVERHKMPTFLVSGNVQKFTALLAHAVEPWPQRPQSGPTYCSPQTTTFGVPVPRAMSLGNGLSP